VGLCVVVAGCGSSSSLKISAFHPWNLAQRVSNLNSCHKIALRLKSLQVTNKQRALYCNEQLAGDEVQPDAHERARVRGRLLRLWRIGQLIGVSRLLAFDTSHLGQDLLVADPGSRHEPLGAIDDDVSHAA
jgi:hypothetical protein